MDQRINAWMESQTRADVDTLRRMMEEGSLLRANPHFGGMSRRDRQEYIRNVLMTKVGLFHRL